MYILYSFKATKNTKRFKKGQRVWIRGGCANHSYIRFRYRASGRYVNGIIDNDSKSIGSFDKFEVAKEFYMRIKGHWKDYNDRHLERLMAIILVGGATIGATS